MRRIHVSRHQRIFDSRSYVSSQYSSPVWIIDDNDSQTINKNIFIIRLRDPKYLSFPFNNFDSSQHARNHNDSIWDS